jgi:hypothetical protein
MSASGIAGIGNAARQLLRDAKPALGHGKQHHAAIRGKASAIESSGDLLARNGWKRERQKIIVDHGGQGVCVMWNGSVSATKSYCKSIPYATFASLKTSAS